MRYGFINNFATTLAAELTAGATTMEISEGGADLSAASADLVYTLTLFDVISGANEIVHVTAASGNTLTVERGKEGTTDATWPSGSQVEMRVTATALTLLMDEVVRLDINRTPAGDGGVVIIPEMSYPIPNTNDSIVISDYLYQSTENGPGNPRLLDRCVALGGYMDVSGKNSTFIGMNVGEYAERSVIIGDGVGRWPSGSDAPLVGVVSLGDSSSAMGDNSSAVGRGSGTAASAAESMASGYEASATVVGGHRAAVLSYLPAIQEAGTFTAAGSTRRSASQVVIQTDDLDLTTVNEVQSLELPANTMLFVDAIDVLITGSDTPGGSPEIQIGTDAGTPADLLAATAVGKTAVGGREKHAPLTDDGITTIRAEVTTAGTGTTYQARVIVKGYVMEL